VRIVVVDSVYGEVLRDLYARSPELADAPYSAHLGAFWSTGFGTSDGNVRPLAELGHETEQILCNCVPAQDAWLRQRGRRRLDPLRRALHAGGRLGEDAQRATLMVQVLALRPDVLYLHDLLWLSARELRFFRAHVPFVVGQSGSIAPPMEQMRLLDFVVSSFPHFVKRYRAAGIDSELLRLAFLPAILERLNTIGATSDPWAIKRSGAVFVGGFYPNTYDRVMPALEQLCREVDVAVYGPSPEHLPDGSPILDRYRGEAWGLEMYRLFAQARVVVNRHGDIAEGYANNMRLYEATGVGAALVTEAAPNLPDILEPEREVVTYRDGDELVARVRGLLEDPERAATVGAAGQRRTLRDHTYDVRMRELSEMLEDRRASGRFRSVRSTYRRA
jgi:hypothetical protein